MSPVPDFVLALRDKIGHDPLWLPGVTAVVTPWRPGAARAARRQRSLDPDHRDPRPGGGAGRGRGPRGAGGDRCPDPRGPARRDRVHGEIVHANGDRATYLDLTFACTWLEGEAHVADDESSDVRWWPLSALPPMSDIMTRAHRGRHQRRDARRGSSAPRAADDEEPPPVLAPPAPVLGVDACPAGWVGVVIDPQRRASVFVAPDDHRPRRPGPRAARRRRWSRSTSRSGCPTRADGRPTPRPAARSSARPRRCSPPPCAPRSRPPPTRRPGRPTSPRPEGAPASAPRRTPCARRCCRSTRGCADGPAPA